MNVAMDPKCSLASVGQRREVRRRIPCRPSGALGERQTNGMRCVVRHDHERFVTRPGHRRLDDSAGAGVQQRLVNIGD